MAGHTGLYDMQRDCPDYAVDFDCCKPNDPADANLDLAAKEYRKVSLPDQCQLREFDAAGFDRCLKGRRLIMIGGPCDGLVCASQHVQASLLHACSCVKVTCCLLLPQVTAGCGSISLRLAASKVIHKGHASYWDDSDIEHKGEYTKSGGSAEVTTL